MPPIRPTGPAPDWWLSPEHKINALSPAPPVTSAPPLWRLVKDGHTAEAKVRPTDGIGVELRFEWDGEVAISQMFRVWAELETAAIVKRRELEARGWHSAQQPGG